MPEIVGKVSEIVVTFSVPSPSRCPLLTFTDELKTLWTDTGVDQNFQTDLGAIGPYEPIWTNPLLPCFQGKAVWTNGPESSSKASPQDWHWSMDGS